MKTFVKKKRDFRFILDCNIKIKEIKECNCFIIITKDVNILDNMEKIKLKTAISILKNVDLKEKNEILKRYYFSEYEDIAIESILSTDLRDDISVIDSFFQLLEHGGENIKLAVLEKLSNSNIPLLKDKLLEYFELFKEKHVRLKIVELLNQKYYRNSDVKNINRDILINPSFSKEFKELAVKGLTRAKDFGFLSHIFTNCDEQVLTALFETLIECEGIEVEDFLIKLEKLIDSFNEYIKGKFLAIYILKVGNAKSSLLKSITEQNSPVMIESFLNSVKSGLEKTLFYKRVFRILLLLRYHNNKIEGELEETIYLIIRNARKKSFQNIKELLLVVNVHVNSLFNKLVSDHLSLFDIKVKDDFFRRLLTWYFEVILPPDLLKEVISFFGKNNRTSPDRVIQKIEKYLDLEDEKKRFYACRYLFFIQDEKNRRDTYNQLKKVKIDVRNTLVKLKRVVRSIGLLNAKGLLKKLIEIYEYCSKESFREVEGALIETISIFKPDEIDEKIRELLQGIDTKNSISNKPLIIGAIRALSNSGKVEWLKIAVDKLLTGNINDKYRTMIIVELYKANFDGNENLIDGLILNIERFFDILNREEFSVLIKILKKNIKSYHFAMLKGYLEKGNENIKIFCIELLKEMYYRNMLIQKEILKNILYRILEEYDRYSEIYPYAISFLMDVGDEYSFDVFRSLIESGEDTISISIIEKLSLSTVKKVLIDIFAMIYSNNIETHRYLVSFFKKLPGNFFDEELKSRLEDLFKNEEKGILVREGGGKGYERFNRFSLIDSPKEEFKLIHEKTKRLAVFFIDISNYTSMTSRLKLTSLMSIIESFERIVTEEVLNYNGEIIKKMGDGILATFKHPLNSVMSGISILEKIEEYNNLVLPEEKYKVRIGIHYGNVLLKDNDIYGDTVNLASRVESQANPGTILVTEEVVNHTSDIIEYNGGSKVNLKGIEGPVAVFTPFKIKEDISKYIDVLKNNVDSLSMKLGESIAKKLKIIMFNPVFKVPSTDGKIDIKKLRSLFEDLNRFLSSMVDDYVEEYEIKAWLQNRWNRLIEDLNDNS